MSKDDLERFLLKARTKTYAAAKGKSKPLLPGTIQHEHSEGDRTLSRLHYPNAIRRNLTFKTVVRDEFKADPDFRD